MQIFIEINWIIVSQIVLIDILLGGDNAILIALACRNLPPPLRIKGIVFGTIGAIIIRIILIVFAVTLLQIPYIKLIGSGLLFWIGIKLLDKNNNHTEVSGSKKLYTAIKTIIIADVIMSLDNVIAIASAAEQAKKYQLLLVIFSILVSIPIIIWGSIFILKLITFIPFIITFGAALLGYLAGNMLVSDVAIKSWIQIYLPYHDIILPFLKLHLSIPGLTGVFSVILLGSLTVLWRSSAHKRNLE